MARLDLNLLAVMDAIYQENSVTRAAVRLNLTQPAVSHALGRLRQTFNDPLFVRRGRALVPTPLARDIAEDIGRALRTLEGVIQVGGEFDPGTASKTFTLGLRVLYEALVLQKLMRKIEAEAPNIAINSALVERSDIASRLISGNVDLVVDVYVDLPADIRRKKVVEEMFCVVAREDHPVLSRRTGLDAYLACEHILVSHRQHGGGFEDVELGRLGHQRQIRLRSQHYLTAVHVAAATDLVVTMPERYAALLSEYNNCQVYPLPFNLKPLDRYMYWHKSAEESASSQWLRDQVETYLRDATAELKTRRARLAHAAR